MYNLIWKFFKWLSGKKTIIGLLCLLLVDKGHIPDGTIWHTLIEWAGYALTGIGFAHKGAKTNVGKKTIVTMKNGVSIWVKLKG